MANKPSVMIDLNILLDVLQKREPFYETSAGLLAAVETGQVQGFVAAHSITTMFYLIQKGRSAAEARASITNLLQFIQIAPVDQSTIEQALNLDFRDFEDAVQMISAVQCKLDCLVTRNIKDYQVALLPVMQPVDFLGTL
jgi:predicted nucleic acid-binding protein